MNLPDKNVDPDTLKYSDIRFIPVLRKNVVRGWVRLKIKCYDWEVSWIGRDDHFYICLKF